VEAINGANCIYICSKTLFPPSSLSLSPSLPFSLSSSSSMVRTRTAAKPAATTDSEPQNDDNLEVISIGSLYNGPWDKKYWSSSRV
jgi:hypothetical protein